MHILIAEDDEKIRSHVQDTLVENGHLVQTSGTLAEARKLCQSSVFDIIVLDLGLTDGDGLDLLKGLRDQGNRTPVIIVSARKSVEDRIDGLRKGGDDYLVKPFSIQELLVRIETIHRRSLPKENETILSYGDLQLNLIKREIYRDGKKIELQSQEVSLLDLFMRNPSRVLSKELILEKIWNYHFDPQTNVVDVLVCRLRAKVDRDHATKLIHTIRGVGYVLR